MSSGGSYNPHEIEAKIYEFWEQGGYFHAEPDPSRLPYTIVIPPPNVTGALHLGHALNSTIQDTLIRYYRMRGFNAEWLPGTDHAGIATQAVVEKKLRTEQNLTRHQLGREGLVAKIWEWKEEYGARILNQLRKLGVSCDWQRTRFTLDDICAKAVYEMFFRMFKDGLIYRGLRLVNWDAALQTAVADDEIVHQTVKGHLWHIRYPIEGTEYAEALQSKPVGSAPNGTLGVDFLVVATTRPETMLADTAVAVHPDDPRYEHLIGKRVILPLMNRPIPIVADPLLVNKEFGTGCVKVTPGHDPNDYACWQRHQGQPNEFGVLDLLTPDGQIRPDYGAYSGTKKEDARKQVVADLEALGLLEKAEEYETEVGHSDRSKTPIEPLRSEQWFVKMEKLAETAMEAVRDRRVEFFPQRYDQMYLDWLGEKRDWCISRQLWWGHRIPVWHCQFSAGRVGKLSNSKEIDARYQELYAELRTILNELETHIDEPAAFCVRQQGEKNRFRFNICANSSRAQNLLSELEFGYYIESSGSHNVAKWKPIPNSDSRHSMCERLHQLVFVLKQDEDVLDTWFSSALWPFSTFGWPHETGPDAGEDANRKSKTENRKSGGDPTPADLAYFYPGDVLVTARGIITLWVARMVMCSLYLNKRVPFRHVHIYPTILDGQGRIMSKSLGNGVDPLDLIEQFGTDATRFTLASLAGETQDIRIPVKPLTLPDGRKINTSDRFEAGRNFCNKLWQAATGFVLPNISTGDSPAEQSPERQRAGIQPETASGPDFSNPKSKIQNPKSPTDGDLAIEDRWILSRLRNCIAEVDARIARYQLNDATAALYAFFWNDFCDWYVEWIKPRLATRNAAGDFTRNDTPTSQTARRVLAFVLDRVLRLLHPIMPFVTEELWAKLNAAAPTRGLTKLETPGPALIVARWPDADELTNEPEVERELAAMQDVIRALRDIKAKVNLLRSSAKEPAIRNLPSAVIKPTATLAPGLQANQPALERLGGCEKMTIAADATKPAEAFAKVLAGVEVYVPMAGLADLEVARQSLRKERDEVSGEIERRESKLSNESFVARAPANVVEQERAKLAEFKQRLAGIEQNLSELGG